MGLRGGEPLLHGKQNVLDVLNVDDITVRVEHLDEPAHVSPLKFLGQIDKHSNRCDGILDAALLVPDSNGKSQAPDSHLVDAQFAVIRLTLLVMQRRGTTEVNRAWQRTTRPARPWRALSACRGGNIHSINTNRLEHSPLS
jgi:hypothetical protein